MLDEFIHRQEMQQLERMKKEVCYCAMRLISFSFDISFL